MPRLSKIGAACLAAFGWTTGTAAVTASYLVVAGGGSGGYGNGGGGGAGGLQTGTTSLNLTLSYTVIVGAGGASATVNGNGNAGSNSQFGTLTASVGGGYGGGGQSPYTGGNGGSGGGSGSFGSGSVSGGTGTAGQGNNGGGNGGFGSSGFPGGGGGGSGSAGSNATSTSAAGNGGNGTASSITGSSVTYAGGGGGGISSGTAGTGGTGGAGNGGSGASGTNATANTGSGGGGSASATSGQGGSGIVIISYAGAQQFGGGVVTTDGTNTIHTFTTSGTLSPLNSLTASYLIVGGGGGGGHTIGGGGGAGGLKAGSALTIDTNSTYLVTVGAGGAGSTSASVAGSSGSNSSFSLVSTAMVGGGGGGSNSGPTAPTSGGSGGGAAGAGTGGTGASGTAGQGNSGGNSPASSPYPSGGGGGSSAAGATGSGTASGAGGAGTASSISGTSSYYAGGGGGGASSNFGTNPGAGGSSVGGAGAQTTNGFDGVINTGSGGGGGGSTNIQGYSGGAGASGVVIISYPGSTQQMAGGTVTIVGGNVIHTFTSSGYLTPLTFVGNSLRFRGSATAYLTRTPTATATSNQKFTISFWAKISLKTTNNGESWLFDCYNQNFGLFFDSNSKIALQLSTGVGYYYPTQVFRDPAAWYHFVIAVDTTQATGSNRIRYYVNGVEITSWTTQNIPAQNTTYNWNQSGNAQYIGTNSNATNRSFDGQLAEFRSIDGQQLAPTAFGTFNSYGVWQPINYGGSYGTNGFYLPFSNTTSTTTLGYDFSPNGNNWTTNNISLTAGATYDSMTDVPTLTSATAANYAVLNPLWNSPVLTNANLQLGYSSQWAASTLGVTTGKFYFEATILSQNTYNLDVGVMNQNHSGVVIGASANSWGIIVQSNSNNGDLWTNGTTVASGVTFTTNDVVNVAFDIDAGKIWFGKNGTWVQSGNPATAANPQYTNLSGTIFGAGSSYQNSGGSLAFNFGQQPFKYTPPSGFVAMNTYNM